MRTFQEKNKWRKVMESKPMLILFGIVLLAFAYSVFGLVNKASDSMKNKDLVKERVVQLQKEKEKLTKDIEKLNTDKGKEEAVREKFGMAKDGEEMIVVVDDKDTVEIPKEGQSTGFFSFFKNLFK